MFSAHWILESFNSQVKFFPVFPSAVIMSALQTVDSLIKTIDASSDSKSKSCIPKSKHFIQSEETAVIDSIDGQLYHDDTITKLYDVDKSIKIVVRSDWNQNEYLGDEQVSIVTGGGSGHFPSF